MAKSLSANSQIKNIAAAPPTRKHMDEDGVIVTEKLNPMRVNRKMVHPDGDVVVISLATGWEIQRKAPGYGMSAFRGNPYGAQLIVEKMEAGFLPFDECPLETKAIKPKQGEKPCTEKFSDEKCCPHLERVMQARRAAHRKQQEANRRSSMKSDERLLEFFKQGMATAPPADVPKVTTKLRGPVGE